MIKIKLNNYDENVDKLSNKIKESLEKKVNANDLDRFIQIYEKNSFDFDYMDNSGIKYEQTENSFKIYDGDIDDNLLPFSGKLTKRSSHNAYK